MNPDQALDAIREMRRTLSKIERRSKERAVVWPVLELLCEDLTRRSGASPDLLAQLREALDRAAPSALADGIREITEDECSADLDSSEDELSDDDSRNAPLQRNVPLQLAVGPPAEKVLAAQQLALGAQQAQAERSNGTLPPLQPAKKKSKKANKVKVERIGDWEVKERSNGTLPPLHPEKAAKLRAKRLKADRKAAKKKAKNLGDATLRRRASTILTPKVSPSERSTVAPGTAAALRRATSPVFEVNLVLRE